MPTNQTITRYTALTDTPTPFAMPSDVSLYPMVGKRMAEALVKWGMNPPARLVAALTSKDVNIARKAVLDGNVAIKAYKPKPECLPKQLTGTNRPSFLDKPKTKATTPATRVRKSKRHWKRRTHEYASA